jgi:hypothetical protein
MDFALSRSIAEQLLDDFRQESQLVNLIIKGCIEYRWAVGEDEREIAEAIIYNAFETYAVARGIPLKQAEQFCENHLEELVQLVQAALIEGERGDRS